MSVGENKGRNLFEQRRKYKIEELKMINYEVKTDGRNDADDEAIS